MHRSLEHRLTYTEQSFEIARQALWIAGGSLLVALAGRFTLPLPFTPVPLTLQNFAVLVVGLTLGSRRGLAALLLYLAEGGVGLPVFGAGAAGLAHLFGPTGGYLLAYPVVAFVAGWISERRPRNFAVALLASTLAEMLLFASGISYLMLVAHVSWARAAGFGLYPFVFAEVMKITAASGIAARFGRVRQMA